MSLHNQPEFIVHRVRAITLDLDDTLWEIDPVIRRAESILWEWIRAHYPRIPETFTLDDVAVLRESVVEKYWHEKKHDFRFLRKKVLAMLAAEAGYKTDMVEPAFAVFDAARNEVELFPDVVPQLELLYSEYRIIAVTNGNANLETIGISHLFHDIVSASDVGAAKPDPQIFEVAIRKSGVRPEEILHVGDHPLTDIDGGRQAGLRTAWFNRNGAAWPDDLDAPDVIVSTITEVRDLLHKATS